MSRHRESLTEFLRNTEPSLQLIQQDEHTRGWGPVVRTQFDSHSEPIQTYTTALVRTPTAKWIFILRIFNLADYQSEPPVVSPISQQSAIRWLRTNGFPCPKEYSISDRYEDDKRLVTEPMRRDIAG
jgi:hypothetical protein